MPVETRAGHETRFVTIGEGPEPALFLHCSLASGKSLAPLIEALSDRVTGTAIDLPGHGGSADWDGQGDYLAQATAIAETFATGGVHLVGHSLGGATALALAVTRPDLVRSATLIEPVVFAAAEGSPEHDDYLARNRPFVSAIEAEEWEEATRVFTTMWGDGASWDRMPERTRRSMIDRIHLVAASGAGLNDDTMNILGPGRLERIASPVLLVRGAESPPVISVILDRLAARLPDARVETVAGAEHMVPLTHPGAVATLIRGVIG